MLSSVFLSSVLLSEVVNSAVVDKAVVKNAESESWSAQSVETQFEKKSEVTYKTSTQQPASVLSVTPSTQSKTAKVDSQKMAKTLYVRPSEKAVNQAFWIFDAWVEFFHDEDRDGYFSHFSVEFDVDTEYHSAEVYARLYLGKDEVFKEYHTSSNFNIFSDNSHDSFVVESELLNGFYPGEYEVLIEVYDAYSDELVAVFDGNDDADLYLLSLESKEYESVQRVVVLEHGGSVSLWSLLLLPLLLMTRYFRTT